MRFSHEEIDAAMRLRRLGVGWEPQVGHYVFDETGVCNKSSPFQDKVYFILNYDHFMRLVGGLERFKEVMLWLPLWDDLRQLLRDLGVSDLRVAEFLRDRRAIESGLERLVLYELVESCYAAFAKSGNGNEMHGKSSFPA